MFYHQREKGLAVHEYHSMLEVAPNGKQVPSQNSTPKEEKNNNRENSAIKPSKYSYNGN